MREASPRDIVEAAVRAMPGRMAVVSSFGTESAVLLKFVAEVDPSLPVLFLDTQWLFKETLAYRDALIARLGLTDVRTVTPSPSALALRDPKRDLAFRDRDACCDIRKVAPLANELAAFRRLDERPQALPRRRPRRAAGRRGGRAAAEIQSARPPVAARAQCRVRDGQIAAASAGILGLQLGRLRALHAQAVRRAASIRDGRWSGLGKTECGIHLGPLPAPADR